MKGQSWYPAAALSAILLSCGGSTDEGQGNPASGGTGIDGGNPSATGAQPAAFYGVLVASGGTSSVSTSGTAGTGGIDVAHSTTGGMGTGGFQATGGAVYLYGPRFERPDSTAISTGGSHARSKPTMSR